MIQKRFFNKILFSALLWAGLVSVMIFCGQKFGNYVFIALPFLLLVGMVAQYSPIFNYFVVSKKRAHEADAIIKAFIFLKPENKKIKEIENNNGYGKFIQRLECIDYTICEKEQIEMITWFRAFVNIVLRETNNSINQKEWDKKVKQARERISKAPESLVKDLRIKI